MGIGTVLNELIKFRNTNVNELARNANVSPQTIYAIIKRDNKKADIDVLLKISKVLKVNVDYFFNNDSNIDIDVNDKLLKKDVSFESNTPFVDNMSNNYSDKPTKKSLDELLDEEDKKQKLEREALEKFLEEEDKKQYAKIAAYGGGVKTIEINKKEDYYALIKNDIDGYKKIDMTKEEFIKIRDMLDILRK